MSSLDTIHVSSNSPGVPDYDVLRGIYDHLRNDRNIARIGSFVWQELWDERKVVANGKTELRQEDLMKEQNERTQLLFVDEGMLHITKLDLAKGSLSSLQKDQKNSLVPAIIGSDLENQYPIGSIREIPYQWKAAKSVKIKIVGVLEKDSLFWEGGSTQISNKFIQDKIMILPMFEEMKDAQRFDSNMLISLRDGVDGAKFKQTIGKMYADKGLECQISTLREQVVDYYRMNQVILWSSILFSVIILLLTSFGIMGVVLSSILQRKREFGIRISVGATPRLIAFMVLGEVIGVYILSFLFSVIFIGLIVKYFPDLPVSMSLFNVIPTLLVTLCFAILTSLIPFIRLYQVEPVNLIKR